MSKPPASVHRYPSYDSTTRRSEPADDELRQIAACIIGQAVEDWVSLIDLKRREDSGESGKQFTNYRYQHVGDASFGEILSFFHSDYGEVLCGLIGLDPGIILEKLESWRAEYRRGGKIPTIKFHEGGNRDVRSKRHL